uniref:Secreted protein n=1 Tax=Globodera pallida TaxID=36090 RepID=A0A183BT30_GLOPA
MLLSNVIAIVSLPIVLWAMKPGPAYYHADTGDLELLAQAAEQMERQEEETARAAPTEGNPPAIANGTGGGSGGEGDGSGRAAEVRAAAVDEGQQDEDEAQGMSIDSTLSKKKRGFKSIREFTAPITNPSSNTPRNRERKTPRRSEANKSAGEASGSFKDNSHSPAATGKAKKDKSKTRRKNPRDQIDDMPMDTYSFDLLAGREPLPDNSPCSQTAQSAGETQKVSPISKKPMRNNPPSVADQPNQKTKAKKDKMDKVKHAPRVGTSNLADQSSSSSSASRNLQGDFLDERQRARKGQIVSDLDSLDSIVNKIDKMRVVSTSSSANMASEFGTTETEIEDESARFDDNMKLDQISQISQFSQEVLDMGRHRMHFLFTYLNNQISSVDHQKLLNWLNTLVNGLLPTLSEKAISHNFSFASEWFEKLGRLENAIELTNFGILLILAPDAWEMFGVERPTKVKGLPEKIGRQKIFKQFDANCDLSSIEQIAQKTWITLDKMGNNVVLEKIKNIFTKMIIQMKQSNAETLKILDAECDSFEKGVQKELGDLAKLRKKHLECATKKRTKAEGKSADNPIEL